MQQILSVWLSLDLRRRIIVIAATLAMFAAILGLSRMASAPTMTLLYAGLEPAAAGDVVAALEQQGVIYDVRAGSIFVDASQRDALRLTLAAEGLPANNGQGYELLDSLSGFGTTSQMFDAAYWRAKEGELARTIAASPHIKNARVHISNPTSNPFRRDLKPSASVTFLPASGPVSSGQAQALKFLVSSAVAGLAAEDVSVIDGRGGTVLAGDESDSGMQSASDKALELRRNIQRLLEARVGFGNAVVEVSVETVTEREAIVERRFDPENRVAISSETEERSTSSSGTQGGAVTVASNLPDGDARGSENNSRSENSETRERVNYEVSETTREVLRVPGAIKKVSVAVLVNGVQATDPETGASTWQPRDPAEMEALRDLVASVIGFDEARGDQITLKTLEFEPAADVGPAPVASLLSRLNIDAMQIIQLGVLALVSLILGLFVVRPILSRKAAPVSLSIEGPAGSARAIGPMGRPMVAVGQAGQRAVTLDGGPAVLEDQALARVGLDQPGATSAADPTRAAQAIEGEIDDGTADLPDLVDLQDMSGDGTSAKRQGQVGSGEEALIDPVERLRQLIQDRKEETVEILRSWMEDPEEERL